jgi:hypothetical protein
MSSIGISQINILIGFEIALFACLSRLAVAGVFYLAKAKALETIHIQNNFGRRNKL